MKTSVALIGFMGVGKSAVGQILARSLNKGFVETDTLIAQAAGATTRQIFEREGEIGFREREIAIIKSVSEGRHQVVACGGGVVLNRINVDRLKQDAVLFWLTASPGIIAQRTGLNAQQRPVLQGIHDIKGLRTLLEWRDPYYSRAADFCIDTSHMDVASVADRILVQLKQYPDFILSTQ
jgi:shikimate kinase